MAKKLSPPPVNKKMVNQNGQPEVEFVRLLQDIIAKLAELETRIKALEP